MNYSLKFYLDRPFPDAKSKEERSIFYYITWKGYRLRKSTGKKCRQCDWAGDRVFSKVEYAKKVNPFLTDIEHRIEKYFESVQFTPSKEEVESLISGKASSSSDLIIPHLEEFITKSRSGERKTRKGKRVGLSTAGGYDYLKKIIESFEEKKGVRLTLEDMDDRFYNRFTAYMWEDLDFYDNSTGSVVKNLRTFLNWAADEGIIKKVDYTKWIIWKENIDIIVLYPDELKILFNIAVPKELQETKDLFLSGCMTCLRAANLLALGRENLVGDQLKVISVKTNKPIMIDVNPMLREIFDRYENLVPEMKIRKFNKELKKLGAWLKAEILKEERQGFVGNAWASKFIRTRYKRGEAIQEYLDMANMISTHTMRRTGITNLLMMGLSEIEVKSISGHSFTGDSFLKYVKIAEQFISKKSNEAWAKISKL
jgi:site-specific recombinase XerD